MTSGEEKANRPSFSIRDLLLVTMIAGMGAAWWIDHTKLSAENQRMHNAEEARIRNEMEIQRQNEMEQGYRNYPKDMSIENEKKHTALRKLSTPLNFRVSGAPAGSVARRFIPTNNDLRGARVYNAGMTSSWEQTKRKSSFRGMYQLSVRELLFNHRPCIGNWMVA